jgi:DNA-binding MarR family transcriptional regulator
MAEIDEAETARLKGMRRLDLKALRCIAQLEPLSTGRLVQILGMSPGGVNSILNRLEEEGLIRRDRSLLDRRQVSLYLANDDVLDQIFPEHTAATLQPVLAGKDPGEVERLIQLLTECLGATMHWVNTELQPPMRYRPVKGPARELSETSSSTEPLIPGW